MVTNDGNGNDAPLPSPSLSVPPLAVVGGR
jgi:hypothetical protein